MRKPLTIGSHLSTAGGLHNAIAAADGYGFPALALFVRSPRQWQAPPLTTEAIDAFRNARARSGVEVIVAHASYLINLAGADAQRPQGIAAVAEDLRRCDALGIEFLVLHPGSNPDADLGIRRIASGLDEAMRAVPRRKIRLLLETTAGQGNCIGHRFEHLAAILDHVRNPARFGVCLDTAHIFAAGCDIRTPDGWKTTIAEFNRTVGLDQLCAIHCNDSKAPLASRKDRHEHIGLGCIGLEGFRNLVNDPRLARIPLILETPKGLRDIDNRDWDEINRDSLESLVTRRGEFPRAHSPRPGNREVAPPHKPVRRRGEFP